MKILLVSLLIFAGLPGCSRIQGYFPDKEKDYQLTTEIPELVIPPDLSETAIDLKPEIEIATPVFQSAGIVKTRPQSKQNESSVYVELLEFSGGATRIRIEDSIDRIWRTVGKAISRHFIEVTDRNELDRVYFVLYDADFKKIEDGSLWDEALFIFGSDPAREKEFRIRLVENGGMTEILVLDSNDKPLSAGNGLKLLKLLFKTIKQDLASSL